MSKKFLELPKCPSCGKELRKGYVTGVREIVFSDVKQSFVYSGKWIDDGDKSILTCQCGEEAEEWT